MKVKLKASEQFIADWYEKYKGDLDNSLYKAISHHTDSYPEDYVYGEDMFEWICDTEDFIQILVKMHLFGYEVEKEPLYYIELPNLSNCNNNPQRICKNHNVRNYFACGEYQNRNYKFTKSEILENIPWAWKFAKEV